MHTAWRGTAARWVLTFIFRFGSFFFFLYLHVNADIKNVLKKKIELGWLGRRHSQEEKLVA